MVLFILSLIFFSSSHGFGMEHHYWSKTFGSRASLMGGAIVGGVRDTSAGFYNPGALGFVEESSFSVSANGYEFASLKIENGAGIGTDIDSRETSVIPLLISGTVAFGGNTFGYSFLAKNQSSVNISGRRVTVSDILGSNPDYLDPADIDSGTAFDGDEEYRSQFSYKSNVKELWAGLSWAKKLSTNISLGLSGFLAYRSQGYNLSKFARVTNKESFYVASEDSFSDADFYNIRGLMKLGVAADFGSLKLGIAVTSPGISLYGKGTVSGGESRVKEDDIIGHLADDRQNGLDADYKTPVSLAAGFEYALSPKTHIAATLEWFGRQNRYDVILPESRNLFVGDDDEITRDSREELKLEDAADSVINTAVALEHIFTDTFKGYFSFRTDFSTFQDYDRPDIKMGITNWDIYHVTLGAARKGKSSELSVGITYSFGSQENFRQLANLNPDERAAGDFLLGTNKKTSADYHALGLVIGYTYFFK
jgi:hypothetical protein